MSTKSTRKLSATINDQLRQTFAQQFLYEQLAGQYCSSGCGGVVDYCVEVKTTSELIKAIELAHQNLLPYRVVGGGSSLLISDIGFPGLLIVNRADQAVVDLSCNQLIVASGLANDRLLNLAASRNLGGLEFLARVPGSIGGAVATNATVDQSSIGDFVKELTIASVDGRTVKISTIEPKLMAFEPYFSRFLDLGDPQLVILSIRLQLAVLPQEEILRRLRKFKSSFENALIGYYFSQPISLENPDFWKSCRTKKAWPSRQDVNLILGRKNKLLSSDLINLVSLASRYLADQGQTPRRRLTTLGYYQERDETN